MTKKERLRQQTELQYEMQKAGLNLVDCGNCGSTLIHETMTRVGDMYDITCPYCGYTSEPCDFPDHFHEGFESQQNFKTMTKKEIIEDLTYKVADIKHDLQVVLDILYQLDNEDDE